MSEKPSSTTSSGRQVPRSRFQPKIATGMRLEERDEQILCDLFSHRLMSRGQIERAYFSSTARCNARLRLLFDHHFVARHFPPYAPFGAQAIYSVGKAALPLVAQRLEMNLTEVARFYRRTKTPTFIEHTLAIVDLWIKLHEGVEATPDVAVDLWLAEIQCRHDWEIRTPGGAWRKEAFKPDAFLRIERLSDGSLHNFFIECDLGHTSAKQFTGKLLTHARYLESGLFEQTYGSTEFKTLVVTTSQRRQHNLMALSQLHASDLFWFTTFESVNPNGILNTIWCLPRSEKTHCLIE